MGRLARPGTGGPLLSLAVCAAAIGGVMLTRHSGRVAAIWPANALVLAVLLQAARSTWWRWIAWGLAGNFAADLLLGDLLPAAVVLSLCNSGEVLVAGWLTRRWTRDSFTLHRPLPFLAFVAAAGVVAAPAASVTAAAALHALRGAPFWPTLSEWYLADTLGLLTLVPLLVETATSDAVRAAWERDRAGWLVLLVAVPGLAAVVFWLHRPDYVFLLTPLLFAAAVRLQFFGVTVATVLVIGGAITGLLLDVASTGGPLGVRHEVLFLQLYVLAQVATLLPLTGLMVQAREAEARFREFFEHHHVPMTIVDAADGHFVDVNPAAADVYGYPRERMREMRVTDINVEPPETIAARRQAFSHDSRGQWVVRHRVASGELRHMRVASTSTRVRGEPMILSTITDVTEGLRAQDALQASEEKYAALFNTISAGAMITDPEGRIIDANPAAERLMGVPRADLLGRTAGGPQWHVVMPDGQRAVPEQYPSMRALREGRPVIDVEMGVVRPDGATRWVLASATPIPVPGFGVAVSIIDVSELKHAQTELSRITERHRSILRIARDGIHLVDETGTLVDANEAFLTSIGRTAADVGHLQIADWDAGLEQGAIPLHVQELLAHPGMMETRHRRPDGSVFDVEVHGGPVELDGRQLLLASSRDISHRKELERRQQELVAQLETRVWAEVRKNLEAERVLVHQARLAAMGEMIGHIAHQWRQPLNGLGLVLANLRDGYNHRTLDDRSLSDLMQEAQRLIQQMSGTIADFSEFFRPDRTPEAFSVREQVQQTLALVRASFGHHGIAVTVEPGVDVLLRGFPREYSQVLLNLLSNARDAILGAGGREGRVCLRIERVAGTCRLSVADDGPGIGVEPVERIFEPYFSTKAGGTGLGLYMSRTILARGMGGTIECRNRPVGAEFTIVTTTAEHADDC